MPLSLVPTFSLTLNRYSNNYADPIGSVTAPTVIASLIPNSAAVTNTAHAGGTEVRAALSLGVQELPVIQSGSSNRDDVTTVINSSINASGNNLSSNSRLISAVNGSSIITALGTTNARSAANAAVSAKSINSASVGGKPDAYWLSDTELVTGKILAAFNTDGDFEIKSSVSTLIELEEEDELASPIGKLPLKAGTPLTGSVQRTASGAKHISLKAGSVVFAPLTDTVVHTTYGQVNISANSVVLILSFRHGLAVFRGRYQRRINLQKPR